MLQIGDRFGQGLACKVVGEGLGTLGGITKAPLGLWLCRRRTSIWARATSSECCPPAWQTAGCTAWNWTASPGALRKNCTRRPTLPWLALRPPTAVISTIWRWVTAFQSVQGQRQSVQQAGVLHPQLFLCESHRRKHCLLGHFSSGALPLPEFRIATNCCSCLRELTPSLS